MISVPVGWYVARAKSAMGRTEGLGYPLIWLGLLTATNQAAAYVGLMRGTYYLGLYIALVAVVAHTRERSVAAIIAALSAVICAFKVDFTCPAVASYELTGIAGMAIVAYRIKACLPHPEEPLARRSLGSLKLPFTSTRADGTVCLWSVDSSGNRIEDERVGEEIARIVLERIRLRKWCPEMSWIIKEMIDRGPERWSGIEVGFIQRMAQEGARALICESRLLKSERGDQ